MNILLGYHGIALLACLGLGIAVLLAHPRRLANQAFFALSMLLGAWLLSLAIAFQTYDLEAAAFSIRGCSATGALVPVFFTFLRIAIVRPRAGWGGVLRSSLVILAVATGAAALCFTDFYLKGAQLPATRLLAHRPIPEPLYGPGFPVYVAYFVGALVWLVYTYVRDARRASGIQRTELQFSMLGTGVGIFVGIVFVVILPAITGNSQWTQMTPLSVIALDGVIAYGVATRRIMEVAYFLRLVTAYSLLTAYLTVLYLAVRLAVHLVYSGLGLAPSVLPELLGALAVAFSVAPAHGLMQRVANRLFVHATTNVAGAMRQAVEILQSIGTVDQLLAEFATLVARAVGAEQVEVYLREPAAYVPRYPDDKSQPIPRAAALIRHAEQVPEPLVRELVRRTRPSPGEEAACRDLDERGIAVAVGIRVRAKEQLAGMVLVGPRLSGRIYGLPEQEILQLLCNQLGIALENAKLYTELQNGKIYNDILLDSLVSGVIAADQDGQVTVFNREAQRITLRDAARVLGRPVEDLPAPLARLLRATMESGVAQRDQELSLAFGPGDETPVRASSTVFRGQAGDVLGVLAVMHDLTALRKLELQVRRGDRLASLGTLSAGMAHEIKNPLVTIKTFTELLPTRYDDPDFRETFFSLVGGEVRRIDTIVNQLLRFARPAKPMLAAAHLHPVLDGALKLLSQQFHSRNVQVVRALDAPDDLVSADADQLSQALINMLLNAADSMPNGGTLTVSTRAVRGDRVLASLAQGAAGIELAIRDTGEGIRPENLSHIFDPFFTTKSHGTGLGLSVAHGIVEDHGGSIDVESEPGTGTVFRVVLPSRASGGGAA